MVSGDDVGFVKGDAQQIRGANCPTTALVQSGQQSLFFLRVARSTMRARRLLGRIGEAAPLNDAYARLVKGDAIAERGDHAVF